MKKMVTKRGPLNSSQRVSSRNLDLNHLNITIDSLLLHCIYTVACWKDLLVNHDMLSFFVGLNQLYCNIHDLSASNDVKRLDILKGKIPEMVNSKTDSLDLKPRRINNRDKYVKALQKDIISGIIKYEKTGKDTACATRDNSVTDAA